MRQYEKDNRQAALLGGGVRLGAVLLSSVGIIAVCCGEAASEGCGVPPDCPSLGYTMSAAQCQGVAMIKCPTDQNFVYCDKKLMDPVREGDYLYSDMTTSPVLISGKKVIGVVYSIKDRLAISLEEKALVWAKKDSDCEKNDFPGTIEDGYTATKNIYNLCGSDAPAAEYCMTYTTEGTKAGDWFLPSKKDLENTFADFYRIVYCQVLNSHRLDTCHEKNPYPYFSSYGKGQWAMPTSKNQLEYCDESINQIVEPLKCTQVSEDHNKPYNLRLLINEKIKAVKAMQMSRSNYWTSEVEDYSRVKCSVGLENTPFSEYRTKIVLTRCMIQF